MKRNYIPTIDISSLTKSNFKSKKSIQTIKQIEKACKKVGFFQITGHGIKINKVSEVGQKFFKLPLKNKIKLAPKKWNKLSKNIYRGYFPSDVNGKEGLDIGDLKVTKKISKNISSKKWS